AALRGGPRLYFDTSAMLVAFLLLGRALERGTRERASGLARLLGAFAAPEAAVLRAGAEVAVPAERLAPGDVMLVRPGQALAADGTVRAGRSAVDEAALSGEAVPADRGPGDTVYAGSVALDGRLEVVVARAGAETVLGKTAEAVRAALAASGRWQRLADRAVRVFVPVVLGLAAATFLGWDAAGLPAGAALLRAVAVLVIACPCALGVATPLAGLAAARRLGRLGVLLRQGDALERAAAIDTVLLDKTGTVTAGRLRLAAMEPDDPGLLRLAASAESGSAHPVALAVVRGAEARGLRAAAPEEFREQAGAGVVARVGGRRVAVGAAGALPGDLGAAAARLSAGGATVLALEVDGAPRAVL
ncbi:MAG: HAD-IC family P-type ATPase, partial [Firmicutes bacterium]|nr:HAD-IC family P-type ATPase [Bacillota bacterium]